MQGRRSRTSIQQAALATVPEDTTSIYPPSPERSGPLALNNLDDFKSIYCFLNTKPDSQIRLLKGVKRVELQDILDLNNAVEAKLYNHSVQALIPNVQVTFSNREISDYASWEEFNRTQWNIVTKTVEGITLTWQILIKNDNNIVPQPHSLKVRIGNEVPPKDAIQMLLSADNPDELMQLSSPSMCRVDFVNSTLAEELLGIVERWHDALLHAPTQNPLPFFLVRRGMYVTELWRFSAPIVFLLIGSRYADLVISSAWFSSLTLDLKIFYSAIIFVAVYKAGSYAGHKGEYLIDSRIKRLMPPPAFSITKGDAKRLADVKRKNSKFVRELVLQLTIGSIGFIATAFFPNFIKAILRL